MDVHPRCGSDGDRESGLTGGRRTDNWRRHWKIGAGRQTDLSRSSGGITGCATVNEHHSHLENCAYPNKINFLPHTYKIPQLPRPAPTSCAAARQTDQRPRRRVTTPVVCRVFVAGVVRRARGRRGGKCADSSAAGRIDRLHFHPVFAPIPILLPQDAPT